MLRIIAVVRWWIKFIGYDIKFAASIFVGYVYIDCLATSTVKRKLAVHDISSIAKFIKNASLKCRILYILNSPVVSRSGHDGRVSDYI